MAAESLARLKDVRKQPNLEGYVNNTEGVYAVSLKAVRKAVNLGVIVEGMEVENDVRYRRAKSGPKEMDCVPNTHKVYCRSP